ncbi:MAG: PIG-L family deacetylase [Terriglobia bacterium]
MALRCAKWILTAGMVFLSLAASTPAESPAPRDVAVQPSENAWPLAIDRGATALWQSLLKLHTRASLIMLTAHPDDEDGGMLAYESRGEGARVVLLTLNRGEGGQNAMSQNYWDELGLVRTEELLAADRYYGALQYFTHVCDYGFSKTKRGTMRQWGLNRVLYDEVRVLRLTRPLVVTSVFVGGPTDGHGNHQVAGETAQLAFKMAGDPKAFPDQLASGLRPWAPLKDYARVPFLKPSPQGLYDYADRRYYPVRFYNYIADAWMPGTLSASVRVPEGRYSPWLGLSYLQAARIGLGFQKSQNGGPDVPFAGEMMSAYHRFGSTVHTSAHEQSFFDGIDISLTGIADLANGQDAAFLKQGLNRVNSLVEEAMHQFSPQNPVHIAPLLAQGLEATNSLIAQLAASGLTVDAKYNVTHELRVKQAQFNTALVQALGLDLQAVVAPSTPPSGPFARFSGPRPSFQEAIPGQEFSVEVHVANQSAVPVQINQIGLTTPPGEEWMTTAQDAIQGDLLSDRSQKARFKVKVPQDAAATRPYFTRPDIAQPYYDILNKRYLNLPFAPYPVSAWVKFTYDGTPVEMKQVVQAVERITGRGTVLHPLALAPAISVWITPHAGVVPMDAKPFEVHALIHSNVKGPANGTVKLELPAGWKAQPAAAAFATQKDGQEQILDFKVAPDRVEQRAYTVTAVASYAGREYREGYQSAGYPGLRHYNYYRPAVYRTTGTNVKMAPRLAVGYVMGPGDEVPQALESLGIQVHLLTANDLANGDLQKYGVILVGEQAYAVREDLKTYNTRLLAYVKQGGVMIVQYQSPEYDHNYGPYPYKLTNNPEVVVDEHSPMVILNPSSPALSWPNKIVPKDFDGWVEERGHGFMKSWDPHYEPLVETHDPGQAPQLGGLLLARYGKGIYVYCAYAFYRQLPEGVPGAYRIFANLVSLAANPAQLVPSRRKVRIER